MRRPPTEEEIRAEIRRSATLSEYRGDTSTPLGKAASELWRKEENERIARQRELWRLAGFGPAKAALKQAMLERVWTLLDHANPEAADALLEFLPEADAEAILTEYFDPPQETP
jgi:hypothetical protein